ncbi:MAG: small, acid-soluble spore protein, alpha/beta type [bacterium]
MSKRSNKSLMPEAKAALNNFKNEVASELGLSSKVQSSGWANMTSKECGSVGGQMVKKMIAQAEQSMSNK